MATLPSDTRSPGTPDPAGDNNSIVDCLAVITGAAAGGGTVTVQGTIDTLAGGVTSNRVLAGNGTHITLRALANADLPFTLPLSIANGGTGQATATAALGALGGLVIQGATSVTGYTLVNGTGTIVSWSVPSDGAMHQFSCVAVQRVTSAETGGSIQVTWNVPDGTATTTSLFAGGGGTGVSSFSQQKLVQPGSTVVVQQNTALTAGAAVAWVQLWGL